MSSCPGLGGVDDSCSPNVVCVIDTGRHDLVEQLEGGCELRSSDGVGVGGPHAPDVVVVLQLVIAQGPHLGTRQEGRAVAFGVVIVAVGVVANILAVFGLRERGEKQRLTAQETERRQRRLGQ